MSDGSVVKISKHFRYVSETTFVFVAFVVFGFTFYYGVDRRFSAQASELKSSEKRSTVVLTVYGGRKQPLLGRLRVLRCGEQWFS